MGDWKPLAFVLIGFFILGFVFNLIASPFVHQTYQPEGFLNESLYIINNGYDFTIHIPVLPDINGTLPFPLPSSIKSSLTEHFNVFSLIPSSLLNIIFVIFFILVALGIITLILP